MNICPTNYRLSGAPACAITIAIRRQFAKTCLLPGCSSKEYGSNPGEVVVNQDTIPMTMDNFLQRREEENQNAFEIEEPKLTGKVIGKAIVKEIEKCGLSPNAAAVQSYNGASVMSHEFNECGNMRLYKGAL